MLKCERVNRIKILLSDKKAVSIKDLAETLQVSEMTVRRDLVPLKESGEVSITQGIVVNGSLDQLGALQGYDLGVQQIVHAQEKDRIGKAAAAMVKPGDAVFIDIGTTAAVMAKNLPENIDATVMCFTMNCLMELEKKNPKQLIVSGGFYHKDTQTFESSESLKMVGSIRASKAFMSAAGASMQMGLTCINQYETEIKRTCLNNALQRILLLDSSKFGKVSTVHFADWSQIDVLITDRALSDEWQEFMDNAGIKVIIA